MALHHGMPHNTLHGIVANTTRSRSNPAAGRGEKSHHTALLLGWASAALGWASAVQRSVAHAEHIRDEKVEVLRQIKPVAASDCVLGQYGPSGAWWWYWWWCCWWCWSCIVDLALLVSFCEWCVGVDVEQ